jgi:hypothetical protein
MDADAAQSWEVEIARLGQHARLDHERLRRLACGSG